LAGDTLKPLKPHLKFRGGPRKNFGQIGYPDLAFQTGYPYPVQNYPVQLHQCFSLLLRLPTAAFSTFMAKQKARAEELEAWAESNGYKRGAFLEVCINSVSFSIIP
jgi:hypothetical protein